MSLLLSYGKGDLLASQYAAHGLVVAVLIALLLAALVGIVFRFLAPAYAAAAAVLTFIVLLLLALL